MSTKLQIIKRVIKKTISSRNLAYSLSGISVVSGILTVGTMTGPFAQNYNINTVVDYIDSLDYNLCDISIENIKSNDNSLIFRYNPSKIPFRYRRRKKRKENWANTINSVVKHKYVPMQIRLVNRRRGKLDIQFLVDKQNYIVLV